MYCVLPAWLVNPRETFRGSSKLLQLTGGMGLVVLASGWSEVVSVFDCIKHCWMKR